MTCIAAFVSGDKVWMGGDTAASAGSYINNSCETKVFHNGDFLFGCAGSFRQLQVMKHIFEPPRVPLDCPNLDRFMVKEFIEALRHCLKCQGVAQTGASGEEHANKNSAFLLAYRDRLWEVEHDYNLMGHRDRIAAVGTGGCEARAVIAALRDHNPDLEPQTLLGTALDISARYTSDVRAPFTVLHT